MSSRNATASWSGYSHQGQVGLLVALREMRRLIQSGLQNEFDFHYVEYENNEDVAISKQLPNVAKELLSVHQVKAYYSQGHLLNTYKSVFAGVPIYQIGLNGKFEKDVHGKKIETGNYEPGQWCTGNNFLHTVQSIGNWPAHDFTSVGGNPKSILRYEYNTNIFNCGTEEISNYLAQELNSHDFHNGNQGLASMALNRLSFKLDEKIRCEHATKPSKDLYDIRFSFQELLLIINETNDVSSNNIFISRNLFYNEFINKVKTHTVEEDNDHIELLKSSIIQQLYELEDLDFLNFLKKLNLNENLESLNTPHYNFNPNGLRQVFMKILLEVKNILPEIIENSVQYINTGDKLKYVLTAIISDEEEVKTVISVILDNLNSQNMLWENHALINRNISANFLDNIPKINNIIINNEDGKEEEKFMSFSSKSKLINRDEAKNILANETVTL
ncbi:ABC-three component system protein [Flavobacterium sp. TSSA_36]|uniref:ABC-three component system protein n=1 Tax=Flavobacterium sp. TSSA_36 TaxID=3447669 RepID=UPI0028E56F34|nr:ABC-three component system protein [uncultured Flavobacterium sp.]